MKSTWTLKRTWICRNDEPCSKTVFETCVLWVNLLDATFSGRDFVENASTTWRQHKRPPTPWPWSVISYPQFQGSNSAIRHEVSMKHPGVSQGSQGFPIPPNLSFTWIDFFHHMINAKKRSNQNCIKPWLIDRNYIWQKIPRTKG